ncbi:HET-domain-containing protein [Xylariaceae sp. AK1471]|nr:HET-domain-containing protein [Xylariaceae sp. AK1471]
MTTGKQFCDACYSLFFEQPIGGSDKHHLNGQELKACAESRLCSLCANIWSRCSDAQQTDICKDISSNERATSGGESYLKCYCRDTCLVFILPIRSETRGAGRRQEIELPLQATIPGFRTITDVLQKRYADKTFTERTAKLAKQWIDTCIKWHAHSKLAPVYKLQPTRLIEVGTMDHPVLRVCETSTLSETVKYTTLTHRWIEGKIHKLLTNNMQAYSKIIPPESLSNNFNDAISVTRMLDVGYIWIDSLCIIQDSVTDWAMESARMADYYEYSYCTLSATASTVQDQGLVFDRDPNVVLPTIYDFRRPIDPNQMGESMLTKFVNLGISVAKTEAKPENHLLPLGKYVLLDGRSWYREVDPSPLNTRAWCYQERLLSSRILHFCKTRIFFECLDSKCSEEAPHGIQKDIFVQDYKNISPQSCLLKLRKHGDSEFAQVTHTIWGTLVAQYSARQFTFAKDRLVAIAGIAQRCHELMTLQGRSDLASRQIECHREGQKLPDYFMGIWFCNKYTLNDLCWGTNGSFVSRPEELRGIVPTWSFGSVTSTVTFGTAQISGSTVDKATQLAKIVRVDADINTENNTEDELNTAMWTGLINPGAGALWLEGSLLPVRLATNVIEEAKSSSNPRQHLTEAGTWEDHPLLMIGDEVQRWGWQADALRSGSTSDNHGWSGTYFVMGLCAMPSENRLLGVVLEWVDQGDGCFRRVGSVFWGPPEVNDGLHHFKAQVDRDKLRPRLYEAKTEDGSVRIKII